MDCLLRRPAGGPVLAQAYADDVVLAATGVDTTTLKDNITRAYNITLTWARECGLNLCPDKTQAVLFTWLRSGKLDHLMPGGVRVMLQKQVKYLEVVLVAI